MLKKCVLSVLALVCCLFIVGCGTVTSSVKLIVQNDGSLIIEQSVEVTFDKDKLKSAGYDYDAAIESVMTITSEYMDAFQYDYMSSRTDFYNNEKKQKYFRIFSLTGAYNEDMIRTPNGFLVYRQFPTIYDFLLYNNYDILYIGCPHCKEKISDTEVAAKALKKCPKCEKDINVVVDGEIEDEWDYYPLVRIVDFPFTGEVTTKEKDFTTEYSMEILTTYKDLAKLVNNQNEPLVGKLEYLFSKGLVSYTLDDVNLKFQFITPYGRVHSNGSTRRSGTYFVHTWNIEDVSAPVVIYRASANTSMWYLVGLVTGLGITLVLFVFALIKYKLYEKAKTKKEKHNNLIDIIR